MRRRLVHQRPDVDEDNLANSPTTRGFSRGPHQHEAHLADTIADLLVEGGKYPHREWQPYTFLMARMILLL
jgi:hypothetical protein